MHPSLRQNEHSHATCHIDKLPKNQTRIIKSFLIWSTASKAIGAWGVGGGGGTPQFLIP